jgi:hypothetical protein
LDNRRSNKRRTKQLTNTPKSPEKDPKNGYWWLFGEEAPPDMQEEWDRKHKAKREEAAKRRTEGYEWFFE